MAIFDGLIRDIGSRFDLGGKAGPLVQEALRLITGQPGGIAGFLDKFKSGGLGAQAATWLGGTSAAPLSGQQIEQTLGGAVVSGIANKLGVNQGFAATALGYVVPKIIGLLTPGGAVPSGIPSSVSSFLSSAGQGPSHATQGAAQHVAERGRPVPWINPWLVRGAGALVALGFLVYLMSGK